MSVSVAEYLGQRTDVSHPKIMPASSSPVPQCPFMNYNCYKIRIRQKPICAVRKTDRNIWIVCKHRLCATRKTIPLSNYQINILHQVAKAVFNSDIELKDIIVKREVAMHVVGRSQYNADFIMMNHGNRGSAPGPVRVVLEMQGGGETSNTGMLTSHVSKWESMPNRTNRDLAKKVSSVGTIETNAWRRQQEQFLVKGNISIQTGGGIVFCVGTPLYDYLRERVQSTNLRDLRQHNWSLALIGFCEDTSYPPTPGPIPFVVDQSRLLFTNYNSFVQALINQGAPSPGIFKGEFDILAGGTAIIS